MGVSLNHRDKYQNTFCCAKHKASISLLLTIQNHHHHRHHHHHQQQQPPSKPQHEPKGDIQFGICGL